jgi:hypothetical protein
MQPFYDTLTNYDLLHYLHDSIEPFLVIEDIENAIRDIIIAGYDGSLPQALHDFYDEKDTRTPNDIQDCGFGHYPDFMVQNWQHFEPYFEEDGNFTKRLIEEVDDIRNRIFHFRSEQESPDIDRELLTFAHSFFAKRAPDRSPTEE